MKRKKAVKYFDKEWNAMKKWLKSYWKNEDQQDLHKFRIQVKKLRAFLTMSEHSRDHSKLLPYFKPVKKIFKCAGELRNSHIKQLLSQTEQPAENAVRNFHSQKGKFRKYIKKTYPRLVSKIKSIKNAAVEKFYESQLRLIADSFLMLNSDEQLHDCRKRIKVLLYNHKLVHNLLPFQLNTEYLDQLQETIGKWHDQLLALPDPDMDVSAISTMNEEQLQLKADIDQLTQNFYQRSTSQDPAFLKIKSKVLI